ncbi:MAG: diguanylate cyclase [Mariprofundus sp.]
MIKLSTSYTGSRWHITFVAAIIGLCYWPVESLIHTAIFHEGSFLQQLMHPDSNELWMRLIIITLFVGFGFYAEKLMVKQQKLVRTIRQQKEGIQSLVDFAFDVLVSVDENGRIIDCNNKAISMFGWSREELIGSDFINKLMPDHNQECELQNLLTNGEETGCKAIETCVLLKDGTALPVEVGAASVCRGEGVGFNAFMRDISERKSYEQRLFLADRVMQGALEGIIITNCDNVILAVNPSFTATTGFSEDEVVGLTPRILQSGRQDKRFYGELWSIVAATGRWQGEIWNKRKNGEQYLEWLNISAVKDTNGNTTHYVGTFQDITKQKENEERLKFLSHHDQLTGLPNRVLFFDRFQQSISAAQRRGKILALLFVDLDGFKSVNDELGHHSGDLVLKQVATRLQNTVRAMDTIARVGGDEFTGILAEVGGPEDAVVVAQKIIAAVAVPFAIDENQVSIGASIGISLFPIDSEDREGLIQQADTAMYKAKNAGRNRYCFYDEKLDL